MKALWGVVCFLLVCASRGQAIEFKYQDQFQRDIVAKLLNDVIPTLPPLVVERLKSDVVGVELMKAPSHRIATLDRRISTIYINQQIKNFRYEDLKSLSPQAWIGHNEQGTLKTKHPTLYHLLLGAILHEVLHYYDHKGIPHFEYLQSRKRCIQDAVIQRPNYEPECLAIKEIQLSVSDSPEFLQLSGFPKRGLIFTENDSLNSQPERTPDLYEYTSPEEAFAVNMEFFLLNPEYQCRRPLLYDYFRKLFQHQPFLQSHCESSQKILIQYSTPTTFVEQWQELDLSRLYEVHYLWAGPGEESFSRFGHAMLRLVFCAKNRKEIGPECLKDVYAHRIISFRAAIDDMQINSFKGLNGSYPSYLYLLSASDVINEYTRTEFRDLFSLPLKLTKLEKQRLLQATLEAHWSYRGNYKFLANNCAHETLNLLQSALVHRPRLLAQSTLRPDSLYDLLIKNGVAENRYAAAELGAKFPQLVFQNQRRLFQDNVRVLARLGLVASSMSVDDYLKIPAANRMQALNTLLKNSRKKLRKQDLYALLNLSELSMERLTLATFKKRMLEFIPYAQAHSEKFDMDISQTTALLKKMMSANQLIDLGEDYGIPTTLEIQNLKVSEAELRFNQTKAFVFKLLSEFRDFLPEEERQSLADEEMLVNKIKTLVPRYTSH